MKKTLSIEYEEHEISELDLVDQTLINKAKTASESAYAPYSKFRVGAALIMDDGTIITGSNQENIAYPSGLCAERVTLFYAGSNHPTKTIKKLAVFAQSDSFDYSDIIKPCGACRQVMTEYEGKQNGPIKIYLSGTKRVIILDKANDLLPFIFDASGLKQ